LIPLINSLRGLPLIGIIVRRLFGQALPYDRPPAEPNDPLMQAFFATLRRRDPEFAQQLEPATFAETWRDAALSIAPEQTALVNRFTFISLLNLGMATVFFLVPLVWLALILVEAAGLSLRVQGFSIAAFLLWIPAVLLLERYFTFARSSFFVPFSMAAAKLMNGSDHKEQLDGRLELDVKLTRRSQEREARSEK
jgi:hypothetical protein